MAVWSSSILLLWICILPSNNAWTTRTSPTTTPSSFYHYRASPSSSTTTVLGMGAKRTNTAKRRMTSRWYPNHNQNVDTEPLEYDSLQLMTQLIRTQLNVSMNENNNDSSSINTTTISNQQTISPSSTAKAYKLAQGQFQDLCSTMEGSQQLEELFRHHDLTTADDESIVWGAIYSLQSLCLLAMSVGVSESQRRKGVKHLMAGSLSRAEFPPATSTATKKWINRLKYNADVTAGTQLLAAMQYKRSAEGAQQLLQSLGAWQRHEPVALLRSGFPIGFPEEQQKEPPEDIDDTVFQIRKDLTHFKVYTIDSSTAHEVDDGLSVEKLVVNNDNDPKYRYWIHIADAHRWCTKELWDMAQERTVTHYLPTGPVPMFPPSVVNNMSLQPGGKPDGGYCCALSLGVTLSEEGDINDIEVSLSKVKITYRLSYDDVNDMLEEGVAYQEEWGLGQMMDMAKILRKKRIAKGSMEGMIRQPIPRGNVRVKTDNTNFPDGSDISLAISADNSDTNTTTTATTTSNVYSSITDSNLLVTEFMILAGEALGAWKLRHVDTEVPSFCGRYPNTLTLLYRKQERPSFLTTPGYDHYQDLASRAADTANDNHVYMGYCQAWYVRRFLSPARTVLDVTYGKLQHFGLGVDQYVQWTSPIRRLGDLQVHASVKRFLRRRQIHEWMFDTSIDWKEQLSSITAYDLGCPVPGRDEGDIDTAGGGDSDDDKDNFVVDQDFNYLQGTAMMAASRAIARESQTYWLYEYLSRRDSDDRYHAVILGCTNPQKNQYAVYVIEFGLEHKMLLVRKTHEEGEVIMVQVQSVNPTQRLLTLAAVS